MATTRLDSILQRDRNSFDLVRMFAAMSVVFGHAFALHPAGGKYEPVSWFFDFTYSGALAVDVFFFLSGILITSSFCQSRSIVRFIAMRLARIWPGLALCLVVTALLVGPLLTSHPASSYFATGDAYGYILKNIRLQEMAYLLPGVFEGNYYKDIVNGALWTLPIEIRCYLMVLVLGLLGAFRNTWWSIIATIALAALAVSNHLAIYRFFLVMELATARMPLMFALGMLCYVNRASIRIDWRLSLVAITIASTFKTSLVGIAAFYFFVLNTILVLGAFRPSRFLKLPGDYSYGVYIYGFVVQQCVASFFPELTSYSSLLLSLPLSILCAVVSWHLVERPALELARYLSAKYENQAWAMLSPRRTGLVAVQVGSKSLSEPS